MAQYFSVKVQYKEEDEKGKIKKVNNQILVDAVSPTEAEAKTVKHLKSTGETREYEVKAASESKIVEVIN